MNWCRPPQISYAPVLLESDTPRKTYIHIKGDWREHGAEVQPDYAGSAAAVPHDERAAAAPSGALAGVAGESADRASGGESPVAGAVRARASCTRRRISARRATGPTNPELLDWLASEFRMRGWSTKQMVRLMVTSATYRQASNARPEIETQDPDNTLLARMSALRLPAELIRDESLIGRGVARSAHRRKKREAAAAEGRRGIVLCRVGEVGGEHGRGPLPARDVHSLPAHVAISAVNELRHAERRALLYAARAHRYAAAGAQSDE